MPYSIFMAEEKAAYGERIVRAGIKKKTLWPESASASPTERPPLVGEVSENFWGLRVLRGKCNGSPRPYS
jgi:hypothetical protein